MNHSVCNKIRFLLFLFLFGILFGGCYKTIETGIHYRIPDPAFGDRDYLSETDRKRFEFAVATANPLATDAGFQVIQNGGSAVDAVIAVQMVLSLVEPQSSGIGGGAFMLTWDGADIFAYNGREKAPGSAESDLFLDENGDELSFTDAVLSGLSVGVPGTVAMLEQAHQKHGRLPWADLFEPAITLAEAGFHISPRLHNALTRDEQLRKDEIASALYYDEDGAAHPIGYKLQNPALAAILRRISKEGSSAFYHGEIARDILNRIHTHPRPGLMTREDLAVYPEQNLTVNAICTAWRSYNICGFPPPSSGHLTIMQILGIMEKVDVPPVTLINGYIPPAEWLHYYLEASKLAFADRNRYIADPKFADPPGINWESLLLPEYLTERASLIKKETMNEAMPGTPMVQSDVNGLHPVQPEWGTSHISIVDHHGMAVSMTTSIEQEFGSRIMSDGGTGLKGGFHLNNELTDFSRVPEDDQGRLIANRVEGGKQPRSSMSPTLIFDRESGNLVAAVGSPGGAGIIHYTAKTIIGMLDWELAPQQAINVPNFTNFNTSQVMLEDGEFPAEIIGNLEQKGHEVSPDDLTSGLQVILRLPDGSLLGGADPRRESLLMGQ
ncbi:MAG: gamma-glutamyltransferase [Balneolales bacterium]